MVEREERGDVVASYKNANASKESDRQQWKVGIAKALKEGCNENFIRYGMTKFRGMYHCEQLQFPFCSRQTALILMHLCKIIQNGVIWPDTGVQTASKR